MEFPHAHQFDAVMPDERQCLLGERWLQPEMDGIAADLLLIRSRIDQHFAALQPAAGSAPPAHLASFYHIQTYPYGYCEKIRNMVWDTVLHYMDQPSRRAPHLAILKEFRSAGGLMRKIWGELTHGPYLQNAIQLGAYYVDAANDTVDISKPKLEIKFLVDTHFRNVESFEQYFDVVSRYYHWDTYPNLFFPRLAPLFPGIAIHRQAGMLVLCDIPLPLMYKNLETRGELARCFLFESPYAQKNLPEERLVQLQQFLHPRGEMHATRRSTAESQAAVAAQCGRLQRWLSQQVDLVEVERGIVALDNSRKQLDIALRQFSLPAAGGPST